MTSHTTIYWRRLALAVSCTVAIAAGAMMLTAPVGNAIPESQIIRECDSANGGTYTTTVLDGKRYSKCCYLDIDGIKHCDNYVDGSFTNTTVNNILEQPPNSPPPPPPGQVVGPPATAAEREPAPPGPWEGGMTLWTPMPPPPGPAAPPPNVAAR